MNKRLKEIIIKLAIQIAHFQTLGIPTESFQKLLNKYIGQAITRANKTA